MGWDVLIQLLGWAIPGGLGASVTWLLSRRQRQTREAKEVHDTYRAMYDDVSATLSSIQTRNNELNDTLDKIRQENSSLRRAVNALSKAIKAVNTCRHYDDCPVRRELPLITDCGEHLVVSPGRGAHVRHQSVNGHAVGTGSRDGGSPRRGHAGSSSDEGDGRQSASGRVGGPGKRRRDTDGGEDAEGPEGDVEDPPNPGGEGRGARRMEA